MGEQWGGDTLWRSVGWGCFMGGNVVGISHWRQWDWVTPGGKVRGEVSRGGQLVGWGLPIDDQWSGGRVMWSISWEENPIGSRRCVDSPWGAVELGHPVVAISGVGAPHRGSVERGEGLMRGRHPVRCLSMGQQCPMGSSDVGAPLAAPSPHCSPDCGMDPVPPWHEEQPPFSNADPTVPFMPPELPPELTSQLPPELNPQLTQQLPPQLPPPGPPALLEHGVPNLLASPHLLPRKHQVGVRGVGWVNVGMGWLWIWGGWTYRYGVAMAQVDVNMGWVDVAVGWPWGGWIWLWGGQGVVQGSYGVVEFGNGVAVGWVGVRMGWPWGGWAEVAECDGMGGYGVGGIWSHWPWG